MTNPGSGAGSAGEGKKRPGVMIPIPQYPLYSASLAEYNMNQVGIEWVKLQLQKKVIRRASDLRFYNGLTYKVICKCQIEKSRDIANAMSLPKYIFILSILYFRLGITLTRAGTGPWTSTSCSAPSMPPGISTSLWDRILLIILKFLWNDFFRPN